MDYLTRYLAARRVPRPVAAPSPGPDRWWLRLRAPTDPALPSPPSPGPSRPGGAVAGLGPARSGPRPLAAPSPGPDRWRLRLRAHTRAASARHPLHVRTAPTPVGKVTTLLHVRTAPTPVGKVTPRIPHTPGRKPGSVFSQQSLGHLSGCGRAARQQ